MEINVSQLLKSAVGAAKEYELNDEVDVTEIGLESVVTGRVGLVRTPRSILAKGTVCTEVELGCSRCLKPFAQRLELNVEEEYFPTIDVFTGVPVEVPDDPDLLTIDEHHILDLGEAIRQTALVALPMKPLCDEHCAGLCTVCGRDLNEGECGCVQPIDSRLAGLADLEQKQPAGRGRNSDS